MTKNQAVRSVVCYLMRRTALLARVSYSVDSARVEQSTDLRQVDH